MVKSDKSKHNIALASIKRSTIKPYDYKWTRFYDSNSEFFNNMPEFPFHIVENELIICSTIIDKDNYSILTTQQLITKLNGIRVVGNLTGAIDGLHGQFKGQKGEPYVFGTVKLLNEIEIKYFIETGRASMIMIYGVRTLLRTQEMTEGQIAKVTKIWDNQNRY